ncbi:F0F1 ATP synthase subunit alpha [Leifsonia aquatica]|uniref:F0F1 ATP synthase subunit alpha n=1 Tax=Leifsonia aquatica TaxID=144185 RepID=UPI0037F186FF
MSANTFAADHGRVEEVSGGLITCSGLSRVALYEVVHIADGARGIVLQLDESTVGIGVLDMNSDLAEGSEVRATGSVLAMPVSDDYLGRVVDALGRPLDGANAITPAHSRPVFAPSPRIPEIAPVTRALQTGITVIDAIAPVGKGQRQLILGDRQTGKTQIAIDTILNQRERGVRCIYVSIGQKLSEVAQLLHALDLGRALEYTAIVTEPANSGLTSQYIAPYSGMALAEAWRAEGHDVLIVFDDLTKHADAYRSLSLLLRRSPGREAYPGDIFYIHGSLLERAAQLRPELGGGSVTALPIVQTYSDDMSAFIPTNVVSITDGQVYLRPSLANAGQLPAMDIGLSVSRVGRDAQHPVIAQLSAGLSLTMSRFGEISSLLGFDNALDEESRSVVRKGALLTRLFRQPAGAPLSLLQMATVLHAFRSGAFDEFDDDLALAFHAVLLITARDTTHVEAAKWLEDEDSLSAHLTALLDSVVHDARMRLS